MGYRADRQLGVTDLVRAIHDEACWGVKKDDVVQVIFGEGVLPRGL